MSYVQPALKTWTAKLNKEVATFPGHTEVAREALDSLAVAAEKWDPSCAGEVQKTMRADLWKLRESLTAQGQPEASEGLKQAYEKLRNLSLNDNLKASLGSIPNSHYKIEPADVPNFQEITPNYLRGGQFDQQGMEALQAGGCKSEVDLRGDDRDNQWAPPRWDALKVFKIDIPDFGQPSFKQVEEFIQIVDQPENQPVFVHCKAGIGRTGLMTACWRVSHGMPATEALKMESINSSYGNLKQEQFVRDFESHWQKQTRVTAQ